MEDKEKIARKSELTMIKLIHRGNKKHRNKSLHKNRAQVISINYKHIKGRGKIKIDMATENHVYRQE